MPAAIRAVVRQIGATARHRPMAQRGDKGLIDARDARRRGRGGGGQGVRGRVARNVWDGRGRQRDRCRGNIRTRRVTAVVP